MLKTFSKIHLSLVSLFLTSLSLLLRALNRSKGHTLPGLILQKIPLDYLALYFNYLDTKYIFITGTNGKTSTNAILNQILLESGYTVLSNLSGSNLKRGILSSFILEFKKYKSHAPNFCVFEVDEASVSVVLKSFPKDRFFNLIILNLSRDQLDRYGEVDVLVDSFNKTLSTFNNYNLFIKKDKYSESFIKPYFLVSGESENFKNACLRLKLFSKDHLVENFSFIYNLLSELKVTVHYEKLSSFKEVKGRGNTYQVGKTKISLNLTKNPASFNNNLKCLPLESANVLIYMNDFIPDGHDVSWFYDIEHTLIEESLKGKNVFIAGTRSSDFFNLLNILNIPSFNFNNLKDTLLYCSTWNLKDLYILSNYSATREILKKLEDFKNGL